MTREYHSSDQRGRWSAVAVPAMWSAPMPNYPLAAQASTTCKPRRLRHPSIRGTVADPSSSIWSAFDSLNSAPVRERCCPARDANDQVNTPPNSGPDSTEYDRVRFRSPASRAMDDSFGHRSEKNVGAWTDFATGDYDSQIAQSC